MLLNNYICVQRRNMNLETKISDCKKFYFIAKKNKAYSVFLTLILPLVFILFLIIVLEYFIYFINLFLPQGLMCV